MKRFINTRQLYFLLFILILFFIARARSVKHHTKQSTTIQSTLNDPIREWPLIWTSPAICRLECFHLKQKDIEAIIQYGAMIKNDSLITFQGRAMEAITYRIQTKMQNDSLIVLNLSTKDHTCRCEDNLNAH